MGPGASDALRTDHLESDLKRRSIAGGSVTMIAQGLKFLLQLATTVILARLLTPEDYGLFAIVLTVATFLAMFRDFGLATAVVQTPQINQSQANALFWINAALGLLLTTLMLGLAPLVAWFFREPRLSGMVLAMAPLFLFIGLVNQHWALLHRQMRFQAIAIIEIAVLAAGLAAGIIAAWHGLGYWSLILVQLVIFFLRMLGGWSAVRWRPKLQVASVGKFVSFGRNLTGVNVLGYLMRNLDKLLLGWLRGARELGFYDKAYHLVLLPLVNINTPLSHVAIATLSRLQYESDRYRNYFSRIILICASLGMPLIVFLFVTADQTILLVLGDQWRDSVPLFRALAPGAFVDTIAPAINWILVSLGQTARQLRAFVAMMLFTLTAFLVGVQWGALGVALAYSVARVSVMLPHLIYSCAHSSVDWRETLITLARPAFAAIVAGLLLTLAVAAVQFRAGLLIEVLLAGIAYGLLFVTLWISLPGGRQRAAELVRFGRALTQPSVHRTGLGN